MGGLLDGKKVRVTGVLDRRSIGYSAARLAQEQGAEIVLSGFGRARSLTERTARRLDPEPPILELDVNKPEDIDAVARDLGERWGKLDGIVHAIAFAPEDALGGNFLSAEWPSVATALQTSAYSLKALSVGLVDLLGPGASVVGLDFDARIAWPAYDWMGVAKAALESTSRYLARDLGERGIRVNLISAGPIKTLANPSRRRERGRHRGAAAPLRSGRWGADRPAAARRCEARCRSRAAARERRRRSRR